MNDERNPVDESDVGPQPVLHEKPPTIAAEDAKDVLSERPEREPSDDDS